MTKISKAILFTNDGEMLWVGYSEEEIKLANENPEEFLIWLLNNQIQP